MVNRVLITGGSGLLGLNWALTIRDRLQVILGLHSRHVAPKGVDTCLIDLGSLEGTLQGLDEVTPDIVIHTAGLTSVELCESNLELAQRLNVEVAENVACACANKGIALVHISTDHVFSGNKQNYAEWDSVSPINEYARTKATAEERVLTCYNEALVVRTNFYGWGSSYRNSFSDIILNSLRENRAIKLFHDVYYTPILADVLVASVHELLRKGARGLVHVVGDERISKYEFGLRLAQSFRLDQGLIEPASISDRPDLVKRPRDMSLSNARMVEILGRTVGGIDEHIELLHEQERCGFMKEIQSIS